MILHADEPGVILEYLDGISGRTPSGDRPENRSPVASSRLAVMHVHLVAMAVAFARYRRYRHKSRDQRIGCQFDA